MIGPLADNGGRTETHALLPGSPAIDNGDPSFSGLEYDQRGAPFERVFNGRVDVGAYESQPILVTGDFNADGTYDENDIDSLVALLADSAFSTSHDLTSDGVLDQADLAAWLTEAGEANLGSGLSYRHGDANLDGTVDSQDHGVWNANKFTSVPAWSAGDFNADGFVDGSDFNLWNANKLTSAPPVVAETRTPRAALSRSGVCERRAVKVETSTDSVQRIGLQRREFEDPLDGTHTSPGASVASMLELGPNVKKLRKRTFFRFRALV